MHLIPIDSLTIYRRLSIIILLRHVLMRAGELIFLKSRVELGSDFNCDAPFFGRLKTLNIVGNIAKHND